MSAPGVLTQDPSPSAQSTSTIEWWSPSCELAGLNNSCPFRKYCPRGLSVAREGSLQLRLLLPTLRKQCSLFALLFAAAGAARWRCWLRRSCSRQLWLFPLWFSSPQDATLYLCGYDSLGTCTWLEPELNKKALVENSPGSFSATPWVALASTQAESYLPSCQEMQKWELFNSVDTG